MDITSAADFAADPDAVFAMLTTRDYLDQVCVASHALRHEASVDGNRTRTSRTLPAPDAAAKFTGPELTVVEEINWGEAAGDGSRTGKLALTVPRQPVTMNGTVRLAPGGTGSTLTLDAVLKVNIPLLGKKLEQSAAPAVLAGFETQQKVGNDWLTADA